MRMMLPQCCGRRNPCFRLATQTANLVQPRDDLITMLVGHITTFLDVRVFVRVAQIVIPCDDLLAVLVDHVATLLDECVFGRYSGLY